MLLGLICLLGLLTVVPCSGQSAAENLTCLEAEFWCWRMNDAPLFSTVTGETQFNDVLECYNVSVYDQRNTTVREYLSRLKEISRDQLNASEQLDYDIFTDHLQTYVDGVRWNEYFAMNPVNFLEGTQASPERLHFAMPFSTQHDFENYLKRLNALPAQICAKIDLLKIAVNTEKTLNNVSMLAVPGQIDDLVTKAMNESPFYNPVFTSKLNASKIPEEQRLSLRQQAKDAVNNIRMALNQLKTFLNEAYLPATRPQWGLKGMSDSEEMYQQCLKYHTSTNMTAQQIHEIGLEEVERIQTNMTAALKRLNFNGTIKEFYDSIRTDPEFHKNTSQELLDEYNDFISNRVKPKLNTMFRNIPDLPLKVEAASSGLAAYYQSGTPDGSVPGIFYANVKDPQNSATIDMMALVLHEALPGHHMQFSYSLNSTLPSYRRFVEDINYYRMPATFPINSAYIEGWALYSEYLGEELGLYTDDYMLMGRYSYDMTRACRLVVDTGLHHFGWDREKAIQYMLNNTVFSRERATSEIDRYLTWPGQATAYKIGELKIKELRKNANETLGSKFDLAEFHGLLLENGGMPLHLLEQLVNSWIAEVRARN